MAAPTGDWAPDGTFYETYPDPPVHARYIFSQIYNLKISLTNYTHKLHNSGGTWTFL